MWAYLMGFILVAFPPRGAWGLHEREAVARDIASTDATALEALTLANIAAYESGFDRKAVGRAGECGAFQVMPPAASYGAREALARLRRQGLPGFMGFSVCGERCQEMADRRSFPAKLYFWAHDPPPEPETVVSLEP